jgi:hypothetical protein
MMDALRDRLAVAAKSIAFIALLLIALPVFDLVASIWPLRPGSLHWRFGASGLMAGFLLTPLLGLTLLTVVATLSNRRATYLTLVTVNGIATVALLGILLLFGLDVLQLRGTVPPVEKPLFDAAAVKGFVKYAACVCALIGLTFANVRLWRSAPRAKVRRRASSRAVVAPPVGRAPRQGTDSSASAVPAASDPLMGEKSPSEPASSHRIQALGTT